MLYWGLLFSIVNGIPDYLDSITSKRRTWVDLHFYYEHRYNYHHHSDLIHNLVTCFAVFDV